MRSLLRPVFAGSSLLFAVLLTQPARAASVLESAEDEDIEESTENPVETVVVGETEYWEALRRFEVNSDSALESGRELLETAVSFEFPTAQNFLGGCYLDGSYGYRKSERKAAEESYLAAVFNLTVAG